MGERTGEWSEVELRELVQEEITAAARGADGAGEAAQVTCAVGWHRVSPEEWNAEDFFGNRRFEPGCGVRAAEVMIAALVAGKGAGCMRGDCARAIEECEAARCALSEFVAGYLGGLFGKAASSGIQAAGEDIAGEDGE